MEAVAEAGSRENKDVVLTRAHIVPEEEVLLSDPLKIEIEVHTTKIVANPRWEAVFVADLANTKQAGGKQEGLSEVATLEEGQRHTFSFSVNNFVQDMCTGIEEQILLNVGVVYIILYSDDNEIDRFAFVTHIRRRRVEGRNLWRYVFNPLDAPVISS